MKFPSPEFDTAVAALCHGTISDEALPELHELLRADSNAQDEYLWRTEVHSELVSGQLESRYLSAHEAADDKIVPFPASARFETQAARRCFPWPIVAVAALALIVLGGAWLFFHGSMASTPQPIAVARLAGLQDSRWMVSENHMRVGDAIHAGQRIELSSGSAEVRFNSGASMKVLGPAILEPLTNNSAFLLLGQVQIVAETPESKGFVLQTPTSDFLDIGTAFIATVTPDGLSRVDVSEGEVHVLLDGMDFSPRLRAGETLYIEPGERQIMTRIEQGKETADFLFPTIEPPSREDYADQAFGRANIRVVQGKLRKRAGPSRSGPVAVLLDGAGQSRQDFPEESVFFEERSRVRDGGGSWGSFLVDLGQPISVTKINSYSWHKNELRKEHRRAIQRFTLYGFSGDQLPDMTFAPDHTGWTRIARVNTDEFFEVDAPLDRPAQQACSVTAARGEIGHFRYLLWEVHCGTFFGEFDVYGEPSQSSLASK